MPENINIEIRCFATLGKYAPPENTLTLPPRSTVRDVIRILGLPDQEVRIMFINAEQADRESTLRDGDRVGFFPAVVGG